MHHKRSSPQENPSSPEIRAVRDKMEQLDQLRDRSQAAYGYMELLERVNGEGPAGPEGPGLMGQPGAREILQDLEKRLDDLLSDDAVSPDVQELVASYYNATKNRIEALLRVEQAEGNRDRELRRGGWPVAI